MRASWDKEFKLSANIRMFLFEKLEKVSRNARIVMREMFAFKYLL